MNYLHLGRETVFSPPLLFPPALLSLSFWWMIEVERLTQREQGEVHSTFSPDKIACQGKCKSRDWRVWPVDGTRRRKRQPDRWTIKSLWPPSGLVDANTVKEGRNCVSNHTSTLKSDLQTPAAPNACAHACTDIICPLNCKRADIFSSRRSRGRSPHKGVHTNNQLSINGPVRPSMSQCHPGKDEQTSV